MGAFNGTCMISNLPILEGEKAKLVFLFPDDYYGYNEILEPCLLPLSGNYNGYGFIKNIEEDCNFNIVEQSFKGYFGDVISFEDDKPKIDYTLYDIISNLCGIRYYKSNDYDRNIFELYNYPMIPESKARKSRFRYALIREDIWNSIVSGYHKFDYTQNLGLNIIISFQRIFKMCQEWNEIFKERNKDISYTINQFRFSLKTSKMIDDVKYIEKMIDSETNDIKEQWMELLIISDFMETTRKTWNLNHFSGSQVRGFEQHKFLSEKIIEICDRNLNKK